MNDQRKEARKKLIAFTPVYDFRQKVLLGYVGDLTLLGLMAVGERVQEIDAEKVLRIEFPNDLPGIANSHVVIPARVAWCRKEENTDYFMLGFEFVDLKPENERFIEALLRRYTFRRRTPLKDVE